MDDDDLNNFCWAPYIPGVHGGPPLDPMENYTSPAMEALIAAAPPEPEPPPEVKVVYVGDGRAQAQLNQIRDDRWQANWQRRYDAHRSKMHRRGYCMRHMVHNCHNCNPHY